VAGYCTPETIQKAADILKSLIDENTLVIASSDFTHYGKMYGYVPFTDNIPENLKQLDMGAYKFIADLDSIGFLDYRQKTADTICGFVPISILLDMLPKDAKANLIQYTTSGLLTGDYEKSVSYLAIAFTGKWQKGPKIEPATLDKKLSVNDKKILLALARKTIVYYLEKSKTPSPADLGITITEPLKTNRAAFVTLTKNSQLRGCIGDILPVQPLYRSVIANAVNACVNDYRFRPVKISECNDIKIEISALTVPEPVASANDIRIGVDGVILKKNGRQAVFLPQVAPEQRWNTEQMLSNLSLKAGLNEDDWKSGASFLVFQAEVFGEEK
jgi:AmmeMemoRadiSam system protein A